MAADTLQPAAVIAKLLDMTERRVQQLATEGVLPKASHGKYPLYACVHAYIRYLRGSDADDGDDGESGNRLSGTVERAKLARAQRQKIELETAALRETLLPAADVAREWADLVGRARAKLLGLPPRLAAHAMTCTTVREVEDFARTEVYAALSELGEEHAEADQDGGGDEVAPAAAPDGQ